MSDLLEVFLASMELVLPVFGAQDDVEAIQEDGDARQFFSCGDVPDFGYARRVVRFWRADGVFDGGGDQ